MIRIRHDFFPCCIQCLWIQPRVQKRKKFASQCIDNTTTLNCLTCFSRRRAWAGCLASRRPCRKTFERSSCFPSRPPCQGAAWAGAACPRLERAWRRRRRGRPPWGNPSGSGRRPVVRVERVMYVWNERRLQLSFLKFGLRSESTTAWSTGGYSSVLDWVPLSLKSI